MQLDRVGETKEKTRYYRALWLCSVAVTLAPPAGLEPATL